MDVVFVAENNPTKKVVIPPGGGVVILSPGSWYYRAVESTVVLVSEGDQELPPAILKGGRDLSPPEPLGDSITVNVGESLTTVAWQAGQDEAAKRGVVVPCVLVVCIRTLPAFDYESGAQTLRQASVERMRSALGAHL